MGQDIAVEEQFSSINMEKLGMTVSSMSISILELIFKSFCLLATSIEQYFVKLKTISFCFH